MSKVLELFRRGDEIVLQISTGKTTMKKLHPIVFRYGSGGILLGKHKATVVLDNQTRIHLPKALD